MNNTIEEIHVRTTIEDYKTIFNLQDDPANKENHFVCPLCGSGSHRGTHSTAGFNIYLENGKYKWHCYACKNSGDIIGLYEQVKGISTGEAIKSLAEYFGTQEERQQIQPQNKSEQYFYPPFTDRYGEVLIYRKDRFYIEGELDAEGKIKKHFAWHTFKNGIEISVIDEKRKKKIGQFNSKAEKEADLPLLYLSGTPTEDKIVYICEGEKDCENLKSLGKFAVSMAYGYGDGVKWEKSFSEILKAKGIKLALVLVDNDESGRAGSSTVAKRLTEDGIQCKLIDISTKWTNCPKKSDISNAMEFFGIDKAMQMLTELIEETPVFNVEQTQKEEKSEGLKQVEQKVETYNEPDIIDLETIEYQPQKYVWYPFIPVGKTVLLFGAGGMGKSWAADLITSTISNNSFFPNEYNVNQNLLAEKNNGTVLWIDAEENSNDMFARLKDCNANLKNIKYIDQKVARLKAVAIDINSNPKGLENLIVKLKPVLTILNPWQSFTGNIMSNEQTAVRGIMDKLGGIAEKTGCAILLIGHSNKRPQELNANNGAMGSSDFINAVRSAFTICNANKDKNIKTIVHTKSNGTILGDSLDFIIQGDENIDRKCEWIGINSIVSKETLEDAASEHKRIYDFIQDKVEKEEKKIELIDVLQELSRDVKEGEKKFFSFADIRKRYGDDVITSRPKTAIQKSATFLKEVEINCHHSKSGDGIYIQKKCDSVEVSQ